MLRRISLNDLGQTEMLKKEMSMIRGGSTDFPTSTPIYIGCSCFGDGCTCDYEGTKSGPDDDKYVGSSTSANKSANGYEDDHLDVQSIRFT